MQVQHGLWDEELHAMFSGGSHWYEVWQSRDSNQVVHNTVEPVPALISEVRKS